MLKSNQTKLPSTLVDAKKHINLHLVVDLATANYFILKKNSHSHR